MPGRGFGTEGKGHGLPNDKVTKHAGFARQMLGCRDELARPATFARLSTELSQLGRLSRPHGLVKCNLFPNIQGRQLFARWVVDLRSFSSQAVLTFQRVEPAGRRTFVPVTHGLNLEEHQPHFGE